MYKYSIRQGTKEDLEAICCVQLYAQEKAFGEITECELHVPTLPIYREVWQKRLNQKDQNYCFYIAETDRLTLGFAYARIVNVKGKKIALIKALYVNPTHWNMGIGYALLKRLEKDFQALGVTAISLFILDQNKRAEALYKKFGLKFDSIVRKISVHKQEYYLRHMVLYK